jgi:hypothetical protein
VTEVTFLHHYAFLVGIDEYDHFSNLRGAHSDARTLRDALHWVGYPADNVCLIPPGKTALGQLKIEIRKFLAQCEGRDSNPDIVVFWAGHGVRTEEGSFLIARSTQDHSTNWRGAALPLQTLAEQFIQVGPASLTMFFDVRHSVPPHRADFRDRPRVLILAGMRDEVRTTFVGVSTFAHEVWVWNKAHQGEGRSIGILADALQRAVHGVPCDSDDNEHCHDSDFTVTDRRLVHKLVDAVVRKAKAVGVHQRLSVLAHHTDTPRKIGFAIRSFADARLDELALPAEAGILARLAMDRSRPCPDTMTAFGVRITSW